MGGVTAQQVFTINVKAYKCTYNIEPKEASIELPYKEMKVLDVY